MSILPESISRVQTTAGELVHDPLVCGIDRATDCPACQRARQQSERAAADRLTPTWLRLWRRLCERFPLIRRGARKLGEGEFPAPWPAGDVARLARTLSDPDAREPIAAALAPEIFAIARQAVRAELHAERGAR